jgi:hypothetical protein
MIIIYSCWVHEIPEAWVLGKWHKKCVLEKSACIYIIQHSSWDTINYYVSTCAHTLLHLHIHLSFPHKFVLFTWIWHLLPYLPTFPPTILHLGFFYFNLRNLTATLISNWMSGLLEESERWDFYAEKNPWKFHVTTSPWGLSTAR